jgi:hypothetical protein
MKIPQIYFGMAAILFIAGCGPSASPRAYVGTTKDTDWPYRYTLTQRGAVWSGTIDYRSTKGWEFWDTMEIVQQDTRKIKFTARAGDLPSFRPGWYLTLQNVSPGGFSATLTGDIFDSRMIGLSFTPPLRHAHPEG